MFLEVSKLFYLCFIDIFELCQLHYLCVGQKWKQNIWGQQQLHLLGPGLGVRGSSSGSGSGSSQGPKTLES